MTTIGSGSGHGSGSGSGHGSGLSAADTATAQGRVRRTFTDAAFRGIFSAGGVGHESRVDGFVAYFAANDAEWVFALLAREPGEAIPTLAGALDPGYEERWTTTTEIYEAVWRLAATGRLCHVGVRDQEVHTPHLARTRWLLLSLPFRPDVREHLDHDDIHHYGDGGIDRVVSDARKARDTWLAELGRIDDSPLLSRDIDPIAEADDLTRVVVNTTAATAAAAGAARPGGEAPTDVPDTTDRAVWRPVVDDHLLPRFAWQASARVVVRLTPHASRWLAAAAIAAFAVGVPASLLLPWHLTRDGITQAGIAAMLGYLLIIFSAAVDPVASRPWLLRQPASAAIGLLALAALTPSWWTRDAAGEDADALTTVLAAVGLAAVGCGYLLVEARNHGAGRGVRLAGRFAAVAGLGLAHAFAVSLIALRWLVPVVADVPDDGPGFAGWWTHPDPRLVEPWLLLLFATAWSFAAGVFAQILWDDRPVTAPLAHMSWRGKES